MSDKREAVDRMAQRLVKQTGNRLTHEQAKLKATEVAKRHDRRNDGK